MDLKIKILDFIYQHTTGVKITDMEEALGEKRMRLGYITHNLLEEGKIQKIEDKYFPLNEEDKNQYFITRDSQI